MIRMLIPIVIIFLVYLLAQTFMARSNEEPIDVDPIDASRGDAKPDDDIIDVEPEVIR